MSTICTGHETTAAMTCAMCGSTVHRVPPEAHDAYAYLLGVYLGDGCLSACPGWSLRVALDREYPGIIPASVEAIEAVVPGRSARVRCASNGNYVIVSASGAIWPCLFPQHGRGRKHQRTIALEGWQRDIVERHSGLFLRGLIHTDGWRGLNRVRVKGRAYAYPRYQFSNRSDDIRKLFTDACDRLDIAWRPWGPYNVSVARRSAVRTLDAYVGLKP